MNVSVERLRVWLLVSVGLLVAVTAGFLGYSRYRTHRFLTNLPKKLGVDIRRETNGYTYSQSVQGRTVYTIHAAKAVERLDGKVTLHDVGIVLYGRDQDRADRIYGKEFEYDQATEVIRAVGLVHIDLQAPDGGDAGKKMDYAAGRDLQADGLGEESSGETGETKDARLIHVTTSGLVFLRKLGVASTEKEIEFESGGLTGHAVGADYNSDTGVVVLQSAVKVNGLEHDRPVVLTASRAELDRPNQRVSLTQARYVSVGGAAGGQTAEGQHVMVDLRKDGSAERVEAEGEVTLTSGEGRVIAPRGEMMLNAQSQAQSARMTGGLTYAADDPLREARGEAAEGRMRFDAAGHPEHVAMTGAVHLREKIRPWEDPHAPWSERELRAGGVELALGADAAGKAQLREARASGDARAKVVNAAAPGGAGGETRSSLAGDVLTAHFVAGGGDGAGAEHLAAVHSEGHARLEQVNAKGAVQTSSADSLVAHFRPAAGGARRKTSGARGKVSGQAPDEICDAVERGHVVLTELPMQRPGAAAPVEERVMAEKAVFNSGGDRGGAGGLEQTTLTGSVQVSDGSSVLWADRVVTEQQSGDATADGSVKASYAQAGDAGEPVHVLAARAEMQHDAQVAKFYGVAGRPARLWQGASQVEAPVLEFEQRQRRLTARGAGGGVPLAVHTVLVGGGAETKAKRETPATRSGSAMPFAGGGKTDVVRVESRELVYSDETRRADFTGGVEVESADGSMRGQRVVVYLKAVPSASPAAPPLAAGATATGTKGQRGAGATDGFMGGSVERVVASGHVEMKQPGRTATGEQVVYTAGDGMFVLTGTPAALPKVMDDQHGMIVGTSLRFHAGDEDVVVSNGGENGAGQRVRSETRVKNKE